MSLPTSDYVFFWKINEEHGYLSQWYYSPFTADVVIDGKEENLEFPSAEHWMMVQKALLFEDYNIAREMLKVGSSAEDMKDVKALGRKVKDFEEEKWLEARLRIVIEGNMLKFRAHKELRDKLVGTGDKKLVEASPRDRIWGVGFGAKNAVSQKERWGLNLLGKALEECRAKL